MTIKYKIKGGGKHIRTVGYMCSVGNKICFPFSNTKAGILEPRDDRISSFYMTREGVLDFTTFKFYVKPLKKLKEEMLKEMVDFWWDNYSNTEVYYDSPEIVIICRQGDVSKFNDIEDIYASIRELDEIYKCSDFSTIMFNSIWYNIDSEVFVC